MDKLRECEELLAKYNQDIILEELKKNKSEQLIEEVSRIDFEQLEKLYKQTKYNSNFEKDTIEPIKYTKEIQNVNEITKIGEEVIRQGKYAVVTMAGGQRNQIRT